MEKNRRKGVIGVDGISNYAGVHVLKVVRWTFRACLILMLIILLMRSKY